MKKLIFVIPLVALAMMSCGGGQANKAASAESEKDSLLKAELAIEIDSLLSLTNKMYFMPFFVDVRSGAFTVSAKEQKIKPEYLLSPAKAEELQTLAQKNVALPMFIVDRGVASLYGMPTEAYDAVIARLSVDVNAPILGANLDKYDLKDPKVGEELVAKAQELTAQARENGTLDANIQRFVGLFVENIYVLAQNPDFFTKNFTDAYASDITYRIVLISELIDRMAQVYPDMQTIKASFDLLRPLNAINKEQLLQQLKEMKPQVEQVRNSILVYPELAE